ncbi:putative phosphoenolpyruvate synthase [Caerostris extrusa]|uniref:Phosphoenolpyruvate synthase n=1 Tax=Caerostris extrusa TaxID=172846 RepID=A0AAV4U985_CAEEX|nr:putative phosphoenolpyruvate synthase [Caerostris extrusa]
MPVVEVMTRYGHNTLMSKGFMVSMFGRILDDPDLLRYAEEKDLMFFDFDLPKIKKKIYNYHLNFLEWNTAKETFTALLNSCSDFDVAGKKHMNCTEMSSNWNTYMFWILCQTKKLKKIGPPMSARRRMSRAKEPIFSIFHSLFSSKQKDKPFFLGSKITGKEYVAQCGKQKLKYTLYSGRLCKRSFCGFDNDVYSDFARLLGTSSNVESANIPLAMQEVAIQIVKDIGSEKFSSMSQSINNKKALGSRRMVRIVDIPFWL